MRAAAHTAGPPRPARPPAQMFRTVSNRPVVGLGTLRAGGGAVCFARWLCGYGAYGYMAGGAGGPVEIQARCVCVCVRARARVRACVRACVRVFACACVCS